MNRNEENRRVGWWAEKVVGLLFAAIAMNCAEQMNCAAAAAAGRAECHAATSFLLIEILVVDILEFSLLDILEVLPSDLSALHCTDRQTHRQTVVAGWVGEGHRGGQQEKK